MSMLTIVTGASRGIGAAVAELARRRGRVVTVQRSPGPPGTEHVPADLVDPVAARTAIDTALARFAPARGAGDADDRIVAVHAAGTIRPIGFAAELEPDAHVRAIDLNVRAALVVGQAFLAGVADRPGRRQLCQLSSGAATTAYPGWSTYGPAKAAVDHWVATVGVEQERRGGVEVVAVAPGVVATAMQEIIRDTDERDFPPVERFRRLHEQGLLRDPADVARDLWGLLDGEARAGEILDLRDRH